MKRILCLVAFMTLLPLTGCTVTADGSYRHAQLLLGRGEFTRAAGLFDRLGEYRDAADYALYCAALEALRQDQPDLARRNLALIAPFKSSDLYLRYIGAAEMERSGDLEGALRAFEALGSFEDSLERAAQLRQAIPRRTLEEALVLMQERNWAQAEALLESLDGWGDSAALAQECRHRQRQERYLAADALYAAGDLASALAAFEAMGDVLDAPARALACRSGLYRQLEAGYAAATLTTAGALMAGYASLGDYLDSAARLADLRARYGVNLQLMKHGAGAAVRFGACAPAEGGAARPLTWRVLAVSGDQLTLTGSAALTGVILTPEEAEAVTACTLPQLPQPMQPMQPSQPSLHAWLAAGTPAPLPETGDAPLITLSLNEYAFTTGSGTAADPYR